MQEEENGKNNRILFLFESFFFIIRTEGFYKSVHTKK